MALQWAKFGQQFNLTRFQLTDGLNDIRMTLNGEEEKYKSKY